MKKCLYIICPTDHLEPIVRKWFKGQKYFYTSLGIANNLDSQTSKQIVNTIQKNNINQVSIILSENNRIILDAINNQKFSKIMGLKKSYKNIVEQNELIKMKWQTYNHHTIFLSYYLNKKIIDLQDKLSKYLNKPLKIEGKLYSKPYNSFRSIYSNLICSENMFVN